MSSDASSRSLALQAWAAIEQLQAEHRAVSVLRGVDPKMLDWRGARDFAARYLRIKPVANQETLVPLVWNRMQRKLYAMELSLRRAGKRPWILVLKYRKGGVSTFYQGLAYWQCWRVPHQDCVTIAHQDDATTMIFRMVERFYQNQLQFRHPKTQARVSQIEFPAWDSIYTASTAGRGKAGRGATYSRVHLSEAAFYQDLRKVHTALAESIGPDSAYVMETTPNGQEGEGEAFWAFWEAAKKGQSLFTPMFFPWHEDAGNRLPIKLPDEYEAAIAGDEEVASMIARFHLDPEQVWWWIQKRMALVADGRSSGAIHQEHPDDDESCFLRGSPGYYDSALCDEAQARTRAPLAIEDHGRLRIWEVPDPDKPSGYLAGVDPSGGTGGDDAGIVCFNYRTGRQAFTYRYNRIAPDDLGEFMLPALGYRWANPSNGAPIFYGIEQNNHGHTTLAMLLKKAGYPKDRVYHQTDDSKVDSAGNSIPSERAGWLHTTTGHVDLTNAVGRMMRQGNPCILDSEVVKSIRRVGAGPNGGEFTGRDLAVCAGIATLVWTAATDPSPYMFLGGSIIRL